MPIDLRFEGDDLAPQQRVLLRGVIEVGFPSRGVVAVTVVHAKKAPPGRRYKARIAEQRLVVAAQHGECPPAVRTVDATEKVQGLLDVAERNLYCHPVIPLLDD